VALVLAAPAQAQAQAQSQPTSLLPNVTYEKGVQFTPHGPVALHVVRGPRPVGLYRLRPVLSNESVTNRETLSSMQRRLLTQATSVGVNGDFFSGADGRPNGITLRDGVLVTAPNPARSSVGVQLDGTLEVRRVGFRGTWRGSGQRRAINFLNKPPGRNGVALFTQDWGTATPRIENSYALVLNQFPAATPNTDISALVTSGIANAPVGIPDGTAVLVARGSSAARLQAEAAIGSTIALRLILEPQWSTVSDAIGGGPLLVRDGAPVYRANEAFTASQLAPRAPRTAIGQRADGSILLVATDGRQPGYSVGMTNFEMAQTLVRLGAVRAMALDGGGSSTIAFEGQVLNRPSDGRERLVSNALMLQYFGTYLPPPAEAVVSPNGDGVAETQELAFKVVRQSDVTVSVLAPDGSVAYREQISRAPGSYPVPFPPPPPVTPPADPTQPPPPPTQPPEPAPPAEGRWTLTVSAIDDQGLTSSATRRFNVNSTIGFLKVEPARLVVRKRGGNAAIRWTQTRAARVKVTVRTIDGVQIRVPALRRMEAGEQTVVWNGRQATGRPAASGRYVVGVEATNDLGTVTLEQELTVRRAAGSR
jgi:hypothetical protein